MTDLNTIPIQNELDIIEARMHVRRLAREAGLDLFDQARISLATSTMAIILGLEKSGHGSIHLSQLNDGSRIGVQVICIQHDASIHDLVEGVLDDARRMVDELGVSALPNGIAVTLIKWAARDRHRTDHEAGHPAFANADL
ncbi:MAG: hypothetical protein JXA93_19140 [Anaerolineae bacterium]|nr:hypothetical protein [Anaerolineae bacterium]